RAAAGGAPTRRSGRPSGSRAAAQPDQALRRVALRWIDAWAWPGRLGRLERRRALVGGLGRELGLRFGLLLLPLTRAFEPLREGLMADPVVGSDRPQRLAGGMPCDDRFCVVSARVRPWLDAGESLVGGAAEHIATVSLNSRRSCNA